jgi:hypothetical protein
MPFFLHQVSYTPEALTRLLANPQDRFDAVLITEMPDNVAAAAIALAFAAGGSLRNCQTTALMPNAEGLDAMRKAATCGYKPVTAATSAAAARP